MRAVYEEVDSPARLEWVEPDSGMTTTITFHDLGDGRTEVVTRQTNVPAAYRSPEARAGFETSLDSFDNVAILTARNELEQRDGHHRADHRPRLGGRHPDSRSNAAATALPSCSSTARLPSRVRSASQPRTGARRGLPPGRCSRRSPTPSCTTAPSPTRPPSPMRPRCPGPRDRQPGQRRRPEPIGVDPVGCPSSVPATDPARSLAHGRGRGPCTRVGRVLR